MLFSQITLFLYSQPCAVIIVTTDLLVKVSPKIKKMTSDKAASELLLKYDGTSIQEPKRFLPDKNFLEYHNDVVFLK